MLLRNLSDAHLVGLACMLRTNQNWIQEGIFQLLSRSDCQVFWGVLLLFCWFFWYAVVFFKSDALWLWV